MKKILIAVLVTFGIHTQAQVTTVDSSDTVSYYICYNEDNGSSFRDSDGIFYSDSINSKIFEISKFISNEKSNPKYKNLIECFKKAKKRYGVQSKFNGYLKKLE